MTEKTIQEQGGTAFPAQFYDERSIGMTLRDYFAAKIAAGDSACGSGWDLDLPSAESKRIALGRARLYYFIADAMLEARK